VLVSEKNSTGAAEGGGGSVASVGEMLMTFARNDDGTPPGLSE